MLQNLNKYQPESVISDFLTSVFDFVCMCIYLFVCMAITCMCADALCTWTRVVAGEQPGLSFRRCFAPYFLSQLFPLAWHLPSRLGWITEQVVPGSQDPEWTKSTHTHVHIHTHKIVPVSF